MEGREEVVRVFVINGCFKKKKSVLYVICLNYCICEISKFLNRCGRVIFYVEIW